MEDKINKYTEETQQEINALLKDRFYMGCVICDFKDQAKENINVLAFNMARQWQALESAEDMLKKYKADFSLNIEDYKELKNVAICYTIIENKIRAYIDVLILLTDNNLTNEDVLNKLDIDINGYEELINYITDKKSKRITSKESKINSIQKRINEDTLWSLNELTRAFILYYLQDKKGYTKKNANKLYNLALELKEQDEKIIFKVKGLKGVENGKADINKLTDKDKAYLKAIYTLETKFKDLLKADNSIKYEQIPLTLEYSDKATFTENNLINTLSLTPLDNKTLNELLIPNNLDYEINSKTTEESAEELNKLTPLDQFVLNTIVMDFYYKQNITTFSDREIAIQYTQEKGSNWTSEELRENINKSILKLQQIRIKLGAKSIQKIKRNKKAEITSNNPLLWLESVEIKKDTTSNYYRIIDVPFYFTFIKQTNSKQIEYDRDILYKQIKGVDKSQKNQDLRYYLTQRIALLEEIKNDQYINTTDIYNVQNVNSNTYPNETRLKKERQLTRDRAEEILDALKSKYNFTWKRDIKSKRIKGYFIRVKN